MGGGSAGFDLAYDPAGRIGQATLRASASRVPLRSSGRLMGLDLGLNEAVGDIDLRLRGGGRNTRDALNSPAARSRSRSPRALAAQPVRQLAGRDAAPAGRRRRGRAFNCIAGRFEVSGGVASLRRSWSTRRAPVVGGGYLSFRTEGSSSWEAKQNIGLASPEARDN